MPARLAARPMTPDRILAFVLFAVAASITPGPNNALLMASGANFGLRRTIPHMTGVVLGFGFMMVCVGLGLGGLFEAFPVLHQILWAVGTLYLLYLAWKIASSSGIGLSGGKPHPMTFLQAVAFQWVNPKAWTGAVGAVATYAPHEHFAAGLALLSLIMLCVNIPVVLLWTGAGAGMRRFLDRPRALRVFNITMAVLLVASLIPPAMEHLGVK